MNAEPAVGFDVVGTVARAAKRSGHSGLVIMLVLVPQVVAIAGRRPMPRPVWNPEAVEQLLNR